MLEYPDKDDKIFEFCPVVMKKFLRSTVLFSLKNYDSLCLLTVF